MNIRQLKRLLVLLGAPASFLDIVTRGLRAESRVSIDGEGADAPNIDSDVAAWVLLGFAATDTAAQAAEGLYRQTKLQLRDGQMARHSPVFVDAVQILLGSVEWAGDVAEI